MHFAQWTFWDFLFAFIILVSVILALTKGLVRELISLVALIGGFILAVLYYQVPAARFSEYTKTEEVASFAGFLVIFVGCLLLGAIISFTVNRFLKAVSLKWIDRLLGGVFGLLRGWAICSIIVLALIAFPVRETAMTGSFLAPYLLAGARTAIHLVPQNLKDQFNRHYKKVLDAWNEQRKAS
jgi:membrane protein required for colicin V production